MAGWGLPVRRHRGGIHLDFTAWLKDAANETRALRFAAAAAETLCLRGAADAPSGPGDDGCALHKSTPVPPLRP